jgi:hypothetical protein
MDKESHPSEKGSAGTIETPIINTKTNATTLFIIDPLAHSALLLNAFVEGDNFTFLSSYRTFSRYHLSLSVQDAGHGSRSVPLQAWPRQNQQGHKPHRRSCLVDGKCFLSSVQGHAHTL